MLQQKKLQKFIAGAKVALGIATSLVPPNPFGLISALGGLGGLFGGGGPSIEEQMFEEMQKGFQQINERLDQIQQDIQNLNQTVQTMYRDVMKSLQIISTQLTTIEQKIDLNNEMTSFLIYDKYNLVNTMISNKPKNITGLELYSRWYSNDVGNNGALDALNTFIDSKDNLKEVIQMDFTKQNTKKSYQQIAINEIAAYNDIRDLLNKIFGNIKMNYTEQNLLSVPAQKNEIDNVFSGSNIVPTDIKYDYELATEKYFNGIFLVNLTNQYIILHPFYLLSKTNANNYAPISTFKELLDEYTTIADKLSPSIKRFQNLLEYVNYAIVQQSIYAGHTLIPYINNALFNDPAFYNESVKALQSNELLRKNFCTFLINSKIDSADKATAFNLIDSVKNDQSRLSDLNALLKNGQGKLKFTFGDNPADQSLYLSYILPASNTKIVDLPVPDISTLQNQDMLYSDILYSLLSSKQQIIDALIDCSFLQNLPKDKEEIFKNILLKSN